MIDFLLIDKPAGITSHDVVDRVRHLFRADKPTSLQAYKPPKVGHAGTLDPFATGLLILGIGPATKKMSTLVGLNKNYDATLFLGAMSDTFDRDGVITPTSQGAMNHAPTMIEIESVLNQFRGEYDQRAPIFSAKKINGKKLYELARQGSATEDMRPHKHVTISDLRVMAYAFPLLKIHVACSSGTYIRSLADDIGHALGTGAYLTELRRTKIGSYDVKDATPLSDLDKKQLL